MLIYRGKINWYTYAVNEEFTIILPYGTSRLDDPIHLYWQWTQTDSGEVKVNVTCQTNIVSVTETTQSDEIQFSCVQNDYYTFHITSQEHGARLSVIMSNPRQDTSSVMMLEKFTPSTVLSEADFAMAERTNPRVYAGKFDWYNYAQNEMFVVILPDGLGRSYPVTAHWQWTVTNSGEKKINCEANDKQKFAEDNIQNANKFYFVQGGYYTQRCLADDNAGTLTVTTENPAGDTSTSVLQIQPIFDSDDPNGGRKKRSIFSHTAVITNNTKDLVICNFQPAAGSENGRILAGGGFGLSAIGFVPMLMPALPTPFGWAVALAGAAVAVVGVVDLFLVPRDPSSRPLFPGDRASNSSSGGYLVSYNNVFVVQAYIDDKTKNQNQLVIRSGTASDVGDVEWGLHDNSENGLVWAELFRIGLPLGLSIKTFRGLKIRCLQPNWEGEVVTPTDEKALDMDTYTLYMEPKDGKILRYGTKIDREKYSKDVFNCGPADSFFVLTQGFGPDKHVPSQVGDYYVRPLANGVVVVQVRNHLISAETHRTGPGKVHARDCRSDDEALHFITDNPGYFVYEHYPEQSTLNCWHYSQAITIRRSGDRSKWCNLYFAVSGVDVKTTQFML